MHRIHLNSFIINNDGENVKYFLTLLLAIGFFIVAVLFGSSNNQIITFNYLVAKGNYPISTLLATIFGIGFLLGLLIFGIFYLKILILLSNAKHKIKQLNNQLVRIKEKKK